jgi:hypothetical protein
MRLRWQVLVVVLGFAAIPRVDAEIVKIVPGKGEIPLEEIVRKVAEITGEKIVFEGKAVETAKRRLDFVGAQEVPKERLIEWLKSLLSFYRCWLVPLKDGSWQVVHIPPPGSCPNRPAYMPLVLLEELDEEDDFFVATHFRFEHFPDPARPAAHARKLIGEENGSVTELDDGATVLVIARAPVARKVVRQWQRLETFTRLTRRWVDILSQARIRTFLR